MTAEEKNGKKTAIAPPFGADGGLIEANNNEVSAKTIAPTETLIVGGKMGLLASVITIKDHVLRSRYGMVSIRFSKQGYLG